MNPQTRTPAGQPIRCPVCDSFVVIEPSTPTRDAPCPSCGCWLWFTESAEREEIFGFHRFVISDPSINTKQQVIIEIIDRLVESGSLESKHRDRVLAAILNREELGSTGFGRRIAIPHAKIPGLENLVGAFVKIPRGVDFESLDRQPVQLIFLLVSPFDRPGEHLRVLQSVSRRLRDVDLDALGV